MYSMYGIGIYIPTYLPTLRTCVKSPLQKRNGKYIHQRPFYNPISIGIDIVITSFTFTMGPGIS
jgi:hypothetical protein